MRPILYVFLSCLLITIGCVNQSADQRFPNPTDGKTVVHSSESLESQSKREQWIASIHKAAPGVDWKAIERDNLRNKNKYLDSKPTAKNGTPEEFANGAFNGEWKERGPSNQAGSILATLHDPSDDKVFCISAGGSLIKGALDGTSWEVISQEFNFDYDFLELIAVNGSPRLLAKNGRLPHYSDDGGYTWQAATGITIEDGFWGRTQLLPIALVTSNLVYAISSPKHNDGFSLYKSIDNGESYQKVKDLGSTKEEYYKLFSTPNTDDHYLLEKTSAAGPYELSKFDMATGAFVMLNQDFMFEHKQTLVNKPTSVRLANGKNRHYFYTDDNEIVFTEDEGVTSILTGTMPAAPWGLIYSPPSSPFTLLMGEVEAYRSINGGSTWNKVNEWYDYYEDIQQFLHADIMSYREITTNSGQKVILAGHHGGLSKSIDLLQSTENITLNGVSTAQFYDVVSDPTDKNIMYAGSQDQGFQRSSSTEVQGIYQFDQLVSGDYGKIAFANNNSSIWTVYPDGDVAYFDNARQGGGPTHWYSIDSDDEALWLPPLAAEKNTSKNEILITGGNINGGPGSHIIKLKFENQQIVTDQFPYDFSLDNTGKLSALAISSLDNQIIFTGTEQGALFYSTDGGETWSKSNRILPGGHYFYGSAILPSKADANVVYYGGSGYSNSGVLRSRDGGKTFFNIGSTLPQTTVLDLDMNEDGSLIFAATEAGPYVYVVADSRWYDINGVDAPRQAYWSVEYLDGEDIVRFGTYGRGVWDLNIDQQNVAINDIPEIEGSFNVYPNPSEGIYNLSIELDRPIDNGTYTVYNPIGQKVISRALKNVKQQSLRIDLSNYPSGVYILQIRDQIGIRNLKLSKQ